MNFPMPPEISVYPVAGEERYMDLRMGIAIEPTSRLFRADTRLDITLAAAHATTPSDQEFQAVSAGCSFGPEIDTMLALSYRHMPNRRVAVTGLDCNDDLLALADKGHYHAREGLNTWQVRYMNKEHDFDDEMRKHGFRVALEPTPDSTAEHLTLDARELRARYPVTLQSADLRAYKQVAPLANLVMCHNVLLHHPPKQAREIVGALAGRVAIRGVLSFGTKANVPQSVFGISSQPYQAWWESTTLQLSQQGFAPLKSDDLSLRAFRRTM